MIPGVSGRPCTVVDNFEREPRVRYLNGRVAKPNACCTPEELTGGILSEQPKEQIAFSRTNYGRRVKADWQAAYRSAVENRRYVDYGLSIICFIVSLFVVERAVRDAILWTSSVPFFDQVSSVSLTNQWLTHTLPFRTVWRWHNEHLIAAPQLVYLTDIIFFKNRAGFLVLCSWVPAGCACDGFPPVRLETDVFGLSVARFCSGVGSMLQSIANGESGMGIPRELFSWLRFLAPFQLAYWRAGLDWTCDGKISCCQLVVASSPPCPLREGSASGQRSGLFC